ncbi:hypothetical protein [Gluconacetobacter sacchari]|uniref:Uncharacterized protein n=1 Tax=Gluconacetobacter sacchari TaxID=92759 RepID=A0A7W4IAR0_9PROT|nr:hypothetical protein [Gluconacetobacter sacchari]MBB2159436.1 hypothetical protein [Gluconacetobacter sacchari]
MKPIVPAGTSSVIPGSHDGQSRNDAQTTIAAKDADGNENPNVSRAKPPISICPITIRAVMMTPNPPRNPATFFQ